jgi:hypothetical protein
LDLGNGFYEGDVENGEPNGYGIKIWTEEKFKGHRYEGYWKDGYK